MSNLLLFNTQIIMSVELNQTEEIVVMEKWRVGAIWKSYLKYVAVGACYLVKTMIPYH